MFGDLFNSANPNIVASDCFPVVPATSHSIAAGGTFTCTFQAVAAGDASGPDHVDTVTATARDDEGNSVIDDDDATVTFTDELPDIAVTKTPSVGSLNEPGGTVTFTVVVDNTSGETVTLTSLDDSDFGDLLDPGNGAVSNNTCPAQPPVIGVGATFTCSFDAALVGDASGPAHVNTVTANADDNDGNTATADDDATVGFDDVPPTVSVVKAVTPGSIAEPGGTVTFTVSVTNTSDEAVTLTSLDDSDFGDLLDPLNPLSNNTCPAQPLVIGVASTFGCSFDAVLVGDASGPDHENTVTADVQDDDGNTATDDDDATVVYTDVLPTLSVTKTAAPASIPEPGGTVTFTVAVTNTSVEAVTVTSLTDDVFGDLLDPLNPLSNNTCPAQPTALAVGATMTCSFDAVVTGDASGPDHQNTVTATAADDDGNTATADDDATVTFSDTPPAIDVTKTPSPTSLPEPGGTVTFSVSVANPTGEALLLTALSDDVFGDLLDPTNAAVSSNTCPSQPFVIPAGGSLDCSFDADVAGDAGGPNHVDVVTATVQDDESNVASDDDQAEVSFADVPPTVSVAKSVIPGSLPEPGGTATFMVAVTNTSAEPVTLTDLDDDVFGDLLDPANVAVSNNTCPAQPTAIPVGATLACSFDAALTGDASGPDHVDTVTATVEDDEGNQAAADDDATVTYDDVPPSITTTKTPSVGSVSEPGGSVSFAVTVANTSSETVTITALDDDVFGNLLDPANPALTANSCITQPVVVPVGGTMACSFTAFVAGNNGDPAHVDVVSATAADDDGNTVVDSDDATVSFDDTLPSIDVAKSAVPGAVSEPGAIVTFAVVVTNTSAEPVTVTSLTDDVFGDLLDPANPAVTNNTCSAQALGLGVGATLTCSFEAPVTGSASDPDHVDIVTAVAEDDDGNSVSDDDSATVAISDVLPSVVVTKDASPTTVTEPGAVVNFSVSVANTSPRPSR